MTIKPCNECGTPISDKAESCPSCGVKQKKKTGILAWIGLFLVVMFFINMCISSNEKNQTTNQSQSNSDIKQLSDSASITIEKTPSNWEYSEKNDEMRNEKTVFAVTTSQNKVDFDFPYNGGSELYLTLRKHKNDVDVILMISKGQFLCGLRSCEASFKFDNNNIESITLVEPDTHSADTLFVAYDKTEAKIINNVKNSQKLVIELPFYQEGKKQFTFDVSNLKWN
ncbi:hypothetical protein GFH30_04960 [Acinetobacter wanghuae]|uniref:Zinc-ribbon domain-containing protein n=1 Tax=Acinetobacter wanghuae TaxID=2662362 RepID=A0A5Q0P2Z1_9GAMM|nr:hypothetical protein [Acinetobacter wanghuae]MQW93380.1 hypothetical protein [Acinetobacter wanghuae]QGA10780.1 hypothetical protein GFH30_04960 [Acinetobacter wanghuae]